MADSINEIDPLISRAYQEEIFLRAQSSNVIAALDTGTGKTYISALLIKWMSAQSAFAGKKIVFVVPKVPLVEQQAHFFRGQTPLRVKGYYGSLGIDNWNYKTWREELSSADLFVMTAQILNSALQHAYISLTEVSLLVFDECHYARKNHPYNVIMRDYYSRCEAKMRPKIFGMTASPIWNINDANESLKTLERNLFAKVIAVREHTQELESHAPKPREEVRKYSASPEAYPHYSSPIIDQLDSAELLMLFNEEFASFYVRLKATLDALGPFGADYFTYSSLRAKAMVLYEQESPVFILPDLPGYITARVNAHEAVSCFTTVTNEAQIDLEFINKLQPVLQNFERRVAQGIADIPEVLSPKVAELVNILNEYKTPNFHGIIFVDQRQVARTLSWLLKQIPSVRSWVECSELTGHSDNNGMGMKEQQEIVTLFREGKLNLLIATSVGEEGLDFPACELVIRFDPLKDMVGYVQSRGRARVLHSAFVVMVSDRDDNALSRYKGFQEAEPSLRQVYQDANKSVDVGSELDLPDDDPQDLAERETYLVESTGAILTYSSAIGLLNHLCSSIPRDPFTSVHRPQYVGNFRCTVILPSALPLPKEQLVYMGPVKRTKKEAKRAAAFLAVKHLCTLWVFDEYLSPSKPTKGPHIEDADGKPIAEVNQVSNMMEILVRDPWRIGDEYWLHHVYIDGQCSSGIITGTRLFPSCLEINGAELITASPILLRLSLMDHEKSAQLNLIERFTQLGLWWCVTGAPIPPNERLTCLVVPIDSKDGRISWRAMEQALLHEQGSYDWEGITDDFKDQIILMNSKRIGHPLQLRRIRWDLNVLNKPAESLSEEQDFQTYSEYFVWLYSNTKYIVQPATEGPLLEVFRSPRRPPGSASPLAGAPENIFLLPQVYCRWTYLPKVVREVFYDLPQLCSHITNVYRSQCARIELGLPNVDPKLLEEALTLPSVMAPSGYSNQRLETLGDSVLKLCVIVYLYNRYPYKHEGQLDLLKVNCVSNRLLLSRAREIGIERFLICENKLDKTWLYRVGRYGPLYSEPSSPRIAARRSLQDCMEAVLGASFLTGGIDMALLSGTALGLCFGGPTRWHERYAFPQHTSPGALFDDLQVALGYHFRNGELLQEAVTHPSFDSSGACYQRLEFLGDALLDLVVVNNLYSRFPKATPGKLSYTRSRLVCSQTLSAIAVKKLGLQKFILANNIDLNMAIAAHSEIYKELTMDHIVKSGWDYDPPKVLSDVLEAVIGAILVDCGYLYNLASKVVLRIMSDALEVLTADSELPHHPISQLMIWAAKQGCSRVKFEKSRSNASLSSKQSISVVVHDVTVAGPIINTKHTSKAKTLVSAEALNTLSDPEASLCLSKLCDCRKTTEARAETPLEDRREKDLDDQTEAGFAQLGHIRLKEVIPAPEATATCNRESDYIVSDVVVLEEAEMDLVEETLSSILS